MDAATKRRETFLSMYRLLALTYSTVNLALFLVLFTVVVGVIGLFAASLSCLLCLIFLALDILYRDGHVRRSCFWRLRKADVTFSALTCLLWFAETVYITYTTVSLSNDDLYPYSYYPYADDASVFGGIICAFSGLLTITWGVIFYLCVKILRSTRNEYDQLN